MLSNAFMKKTLVYLLLIYFLACPALKASSTDSLCFQNQLSLNGLYNPTQKSKFLFRGMYVPQLDYLRDFSDDRRISAEVSGRFNLHWASPSNFTDDASDPFVSASLYRAWVRFSSQRNEIRAGLQQLNFGSASLLRPLQWFDGIDPTDPLRMTNGVWGVLDRIYFKNNSTLWLWGLYGNRDPRIWEPYKLQNDHPEFGFRFQQPVSKGELAISSNYRKVEMYLGTYFESNYEEVKIGLDGKWDVGPSVWFENSYKFTSLYSPLKVGWNLLTIGADLAPESLDGFTLTGEHLLSTGYTEMGTSFTNSSALMALWPINFFSRLSGILLYSWEADYLFRYLTYSVDSDKSSFHVIGFWNPKRIIIQNSLATSTGSFAGYGVQLMYVIHI